MSALFENILTTVCRTVRWCEQVTAANAAEFCSNCLHSAGPGCSALTAVSKVAACILYGTIIEWTGGPRCSGPS